MLQGRRPWVSRRAVLTWFPSGLSIAVTPRSEEGKTDRQALGLLLLVLSPCPTDHLSLRANVSISGREQKGQVAIPFNHLFLVIFHFSLTSYSPPSWTLLPQLTWRPWVYNGVTVSVLPLHSTMSSRHSASPVVFSSARSSPKEELHPTTTSQLAPSFSSASSSSSGPRTFYPRQGATSKYLIGWKKPEGTINSVGFMDTRK